MCDNHYINNNNNNNKQDKVRKGARLEDGKKAHTSDHKKWTRRSFLATAGLATAGATAFLNGFGLKAFANSPLMAMLNGNNTERVLVLIRLKGGNDGINMLIPEYDRGNYELHRPTIAIPESETLSLDAGHSLNPNMASILPMWNDGKMKAVQAVAYPQQNGSHFRSSDIWASASDRDEYVNSGWIGRFLEQEYPVYTEAPPAVPPALQIGSESNLVFRGDDGDMSLVLNDVNEFYQIAQTGQLYDTVNLPNCVYGEELGFMRIVANSSYRFSDAIKAAYDRSTTDTAYPDNNLAEQLEVVARLIKGDLGTKVYMVSIGGFDNHSNQLGSHNTLLQRVADSVKAFFDDLGVSGHSQNVLAMTFSEFGRRVFENGSMGTDHGEAAPIFLFGDDINGNGILGDNPSIAEEDWVGPGNLSMGIDFRTIYATILQDWFCMDPLVVDFIMMDTFSRIPGLVNACTPEIGSSNTAVLQGHQPNTTITGATIIKYAILVGGVVQIKIKNKAGQVLAIPFNDFQKDGSYSFQFIPQQYNIPPGEYIYQINTGGKIYSRLFEVYY